MKSFKPTLISLAIVVSLSACQSTTQSFSVLPQTQESVQIIKSQSDQRQYQYLTLDNELKVLMISDPTTEKSAAAMDVSVGAFHAPHDREGLFHFLEHMLFLGTEKYPNAGEYNEFLKKNGGSSNAYTSTEDTNYFFDVKNQAFEEALDRFAQFFIAPTMDRQFVEREKNAVDSEYSLKIKDDSRRIAEANKQAINPEHPYSKFSVGNLETLADRDGDKVYDALLKGYQEHYSANRMALVVLSSQPLAELETMVRSKFSAIKNNGKPKPKLNNKLLTKNEKATRVMIEPLREMRTLTLTFPIADSSQFRAKKPLAIIAHLLGHEGEHSLYQRLNQQGLIESLSAYETDTDALDIFTISVELTESGLGEIDNITQQIFQYIDLIEQQGVTQAYYDEIKNIANLDFAFQEKRNPMSTVYQLAPVLQDTPAQNVLNTYYQYQGFDAALTKQFLAQLTPDNMQQTLVAPNVKTTHVEPLYDVGYTIEKISSERLATWRDAKADSTMQLPNLNPFIAQDIAIKSTSSDEKPNIIVQEPGLTLWHYQDTSFNVPKSSVFMRLESPLAGNNMENRAKLALANRLIEDKLNSYGYDAKLAGLGYRIFSSNKGLGYTVNGYNDKQIELIKTINQTIVDFDIAANKFDMLKASVIRDLNNAKLDRPISQVFSRTRRELGFDPYASVALANALVPITLDEVKHYMNALLSDVNVKVFTHGNSSKNEAIAIANNIRENFLRSDNVGQGVQAKIRQMTKGERNIIEMDIDHDDSAIVVTYPVASSMDNIAQTKLLSQILGAAFFNELRTNQQLGYIVGASAGDRENLPTLNFYIQSSKVDPVELNKRIDDFIAQQFELLKSMSVDSFNQHKAGLLTNINKKDKNLMGRSSRLWRDLLSGYQDFNKREQLSQAIESTSLEQLIDTYEKTLISEQAPRLITRNFGHAHREKNYAAANEDKRVCRLEQCWSIQ